MFSVVYLGLPGFPFGTAPIQKMRLVARSLSCTGVHVTILCSRASHSHKRVPWLRSHGRFEGVEYIYTSGYPYRNPHFLIRNWHKIIGELNKIRILWLLSRRHRLDAAIVVTQSFGELLSYYVLSRFLAIKLIFDHAELCSGIPSRNRWYQKLNDLLLDHFMVALVDGIIPISRFLEDRVRQIDPGKAVMRMPVLVDMDRFTPQQTTGKKSYFLFCGALEYSEVIDFILSAFDMLNLGDVGFSLYLVVNGNRQQFKALDGSVSRRRNKDRIRILQGLTDSELARVYAGAAALLIPLRPTRQDVARFPHKIGEYLATGNPVITTCVGEVAEYLKDGETAIIAHRYDIEEYAARMQWVFEHPDIAEAIGRRGQMVASMKFDYRIYSEPLRRFLEGVLSNERTSSLN